MYGIIGQMDSLPGKREKLIEILIAGTQNMPGCKLYAVSATANSETGIWISEIWDSEESHLSSLLLPEVKQAIDEGRPLIASFGDRHVVAPSGGFGVN